VSVEPLIRIEPSNANDYWVKSTETIDLFSLQPSLVDDGSGPEQLQN
jgi:hypothetical protein